MTIGTVCHVHSTHSGMWSFSNAQGGDDLAAFHLRLTLLELQNYRKIHTHKYTMLSKVH